MKENYEYQCRKCVKGFKSHELLQRHNKSKHDPSKKAMCDVCFCTFKSNSELNRHKNHKHVKYAGYNCEICAKTFSYKSALLIHMRRHENKQVVPCSYKDCAFKFTN